MRLLRALLACAAFLALVATASANHDPNHYFSGNWNLVVQTPIGQKNGTISFKAVTPAQGEAAIQAMGVMKGSRNQFCWSSDPGQYYVGSYDGGIGEGYSLSSSGTPAPPDGTHAGCLDGNTYKGWFKNSNPAFVEGQLRIVPGNGQIADASSWHYGDFGNADFFLSGTFAGHFAGDGSDENVDTDRDGLPDRWETQGYDHDRDGTIDVQLPQMGADPRHKDIFVQLDLMVGHPIQPAAIKKVVDAFASAPVSNPDGKPGINLHVDMGPNSVMKPGVNWGSLSTSGRTPHEEAFGSGDEKKYDWSELDQLKARTFPPARTPIFRYAVAVHRYGSSSNESSGLSRGLRSSNFLIAPGSFCTGNVECQGTLEEQAGTFMHELGHTLGLRHGGDTDTNHKPNYLSIMNYSFQLSGLKKTGDAVYLDYSRYRKQGSGAGGQVMPDLDESALDENEGFGPLRSELPSFETRWDCSVGTSSITGKIDWNCNGKFDTGEQSLDINGDASKTVLTSYDDWANLVFKGGSIGAPGAPAPPQQTASGDAPAKELIASARVMLGDAKPPTLKVKGKRRIRGKRGRLTITATDGKQIAALVVGDGHTWYQFFAKPDAKSMSAFVLLTRRGVYHLTASAVDQVGNSSRPKRITAVVGRGARTTVSAGGNPVVMAGRNTFGQSNGNGNHVGIH